MSFKTSSLELVDWTVVKVPLMNEMDLHTFWGEADLRLVGYCVPQTPDVELMKNGLPKIHNHSTNQYLFSIDVKHESNHPESPFSIENSFPTKMVNRNLSEKRMSNRSNSGTDLISLVEAQYQPMGSKFDDTSLRCDSSDNEDISQRVSRTRVEDDSGTSSDEEVIAEESDDDDIYFSAGEGEDSDEVH
eukprot:CAMPEP_0119048652 /NCGR_PEP_ID=MMETSP1177-20130426/60197_1 /TAXON_ID=2985 /ORGANISM="Ochromonas sp, Strain CCMP1899" /LENGTH=188 /DNA_ID=CAMNT_0007024845 /DNA_START=128 /DNA_END=691 /DNA_ORIENTATION=-